MAITATDILLAASKIARQFVEPYWVIVKQSKSHIAIGTEETPDCTSPMVVINMTCVPSNRTVADNTRSSQVVKFFRSHTKLCFISVLTSESRMFSRPFCRTNTCATFTPTRWMSRSAFRENDKGFRFATFRASPTITLWRKFIPCPVITFFRTIITDTVKVAFKAFATSCTNYLNSRFSWSSHKSIIPQTLGGMQWL